MKTTLKTPSRSLIKIHLLKYQMYKNYNKYSFNSSLNNVTVELKQALRIIHLYNIKNKKILFIGFPYNKALQNQLSHFFISKHFYLKKTLSGNFNSLTNSGVLYKNPDLVVFNSTSEKDINILIKLKKLNIPLILFGNSDNISHKNYNISGFLQNKKIKKFCFFLIFTILTRSIKLF